jgi:hypothetical protein
MVDVGNPSILKAHDRISAFTAGGGSMEKSFQPSRKPTGWRSVGANSRVCPKEHPGDRAVWSCKSIFKTFQRSNLSEKIQGTDEDVEINLTLIWSPVSLA